jgi:hypothetical protein
VRMIGCRLGRWSDPRRDWLRALRADLSTTPEAALAAAGPVGVSR